MPFDHIAEHHTLALMSAASAQVAAIPLRWTNGRPEVLLVTTRRTGRWTVPKGWPLADSLGAECAAREAFEEAGVRGRMEQYSLGTFEYWKRAKSGRVFLTATAYTLHVEETVLDWPERTERKRAWFTPEVAARLVNNDELSTLIGVAVQMHAASCADNAPVLAIGMN